jgi:Chaperone of endosialidase
VTRTNLVLATLLLGLTMTVTQAQTTSFTYQGRFTDGGTAANGTYDMQFKLFDTANAGAGNQIGSTITNGAVLVSNGVFTVQLDYGAPAFPGADRYLEMGVRLAGDANPYTILSPRQQLTSAVYAIRAKSAATADTATTATTATNATNASQLGGIAAGQYVQTSDSRLSDSRPPTPGSASYIQNTNNQQAANFNISGNGSAGGTLSAKVVNTTTNYSIGGSPVLSVTGGVGGPNSNTFAGVGTGIANTPTSFNDGNYNSFFGISSGTANTGGYGNSFFGGLSGLHNTVGTQNSFFGGFSGWHNTGGSFNSFYGQDTGAANTTGEKNAFFGTFAGSTNETGSNLTVIGSGADVVSTSLTNATAIGADAVVSLSNSLVLGSIKGLNFALADTNVGIGTTAPAYRLTVKTPTNNYGVVHTDGTVTVGTVVNSTGGEFGTKSNHPLSFFVNNGGAAMTIETGGTVKINTLGAAGNTSLCRNASNQISTCSSSLRYKTNINPFIGGLAVLNRLRPITFDWKEGGMHDLGFGAEDIAAVEPLLVTHNNKGEVEGVKYDRITAVLVNAVKEQQEQIKRQQTQIESLKQLVCMRNRRAPVCGAVGSGR